MELLKGVESLHTWSPETRKTVSDSIEEWCETQSSDPVKMLRTITMASRRVGVWLSCATARTVLGHTKPNDNFYTSCLNTAEKWVRGQATVGVCQDEVERLTRYHSRLVKLGLWQEFAGLAVIHAAKDVYADPEEFGMALAHAGTCTANYDSYGKGDWTSLLGAHRDMAAVVVANNIRAALDEAAKGYELETLGLR